MGNSFLTAWDIIKRFLIGWAVTFGVLTVISCVKYREFIASVLHEGVWAWINAVLPLVLIIYVLFSLVRSVFFPSGR